MVLFSNLVTIIQAALGFSILILVHELGHFLMAKWIGVRVEAFSLGFGPYLGRKWGETEYRLSLVPVGGYVKMAGEQREEGKKPDPRDFVSKSVGRRALVFVAGPIMNLVLAFVAFIIAFQMGVDVVPAQAGYIVPGSPAWHAGIHRGDKIVSLNGRSEYLDFEDVAMASALGNPDKGLDLTLQRGSERFKTHILPKYVKERGIQSIGIGRPLEPVVSQFFDQAGRCPARDAGLQEGDRILGVGLADSGGEIVDLEVVDGPDDVGRVVRNSRGNRVECQYRRETESGTVTGRVGVTPARATGDLGRSIGVTLGSNVVEDVRRDTWIGPLDPREGDRIVSIGDKKGIRTETEVREAFAAAAGREVEVVLRREGEAAPLSRKLQIPAEHDIEDVLVMDPSNVVDAVTPGFPADRAGMRPGDRVTRVAGKPLDSAEDFVELLLKAGDKPVQIGWEHDGEGKAATLVPEPIWFIGVNWRLVEERLPIGPWQACRRGTRKALLWIRRFYHTLVGFVTGRVATRHLGGPITIGQITYTAAKYGLPKLIYFVGLISINLGLMNLIPIPILDGGHLFFAAVEKAQGKPVSERMQNAASYAGLALILTLVLFTTWNDLWRLFGGG